MTGEGVEVLQSLETQRSTVTKPGIHVIVGSRVCVHGHQKQADTEVSDQSFREESQKEDNFEDITDSGKR